MKRVLMIHGFEGEPNGGWRPWLMGKLAREEVWACSLAMPTPSEPKKDEWIKTIIDSVGFSKEDVILIGHSLGVTAILRYLEALDSGDKIFGAILVSGPIKKSKDGFSKMDTFFETDFNFEIIKNRCENFVVIHGDTDTAVPFAQAVELSNELNCELMCIPGGGHLNDSSGWHELPEALEAINKMINK